MLQVYHVSKNANSLWPLKVSLASKINMKRTNKNVVTNISCFKITICQPPVNINRCYKLIKTYSQGYVLFYIPEFFPRSFYEVLNFFLTCEEKWGVFPHMWGKMRCFSSHFSDFLPQEAWTLNLFHDNYRQIWELYTPLHYFLTMTKKWFLVSTLFIFYFIKKLVQSF